MKIRFIAVLVLLLSGCVSPGAQSGSGGGSPPAAPTPYGGLKTMEAYEVGLEDLGEEVQVFCATEAQDVLIRDRLKETTVHLGNNNDEWLLPLIQRVCNPLTPTGE